ncbi:hypothetical protein [Gynuella sunshinyii]|uniref:Uncharacterized protein n=1 Tax=Gynuella sunshinyii YC6258 TaxID=1445510 RepID=A0A0C5VPM8_9GAMM|nr:hypothetical protein [Gynuella sunshinyii]AJQ95353.1 hypothetical Protein YC6258_03317 [Gynuella sunshinyii YC6258]
MTHPHQLQTLIKVSVAQIKCIVADSNQSVTELTDAFIGIAGIIEKLRQTDKPQAMDIDKDLHELYQKVHQGIVAFQFFDRMSQRLEHVTDTLEKVEHYQQHEQQDASALLVQLRTALTSESERIVFDQVMHGHSVTTALQSYLQYEQEHLRKHDQDIELF